MSEIFEAVIVVRPAQELPGCTIATDGFRRFSATKDVLVFLRIADRSIPFDPKSVEGLAVMASTHSDASIAAFYDNRVGHRTAAVFSGGELKRRFDPKDEIWVELNESGHPDFDGPKFTADSLVAGVEYDCQHNAIDLALAEVGAPDSVSCSRLKQIFFSREV